MHDPDRSGVLPPTPPVPLPQPLTNIVGGPDGVGFLEWHRPRGGVKTLVGAVAERPVDAA